MNELDTHFNCIHDIALEEVGKSNGHQMLSERLQPPFDSVNASQIQSWVSKLCRMLTTDCWGTRDFKSSCEKHGGHILYVAETGDVPEIINVGYPMMETPHSFQRICQLADRSTILLPQLIENISTTSIDDDPYFECTDLFHCYLDDFGLAMPEIEDIENMVASRLLVDSLAILAMIKSWRVSAPKPKADVYFCTSSGSYAFGRPICIQKFAR